MAVGSLKSVTFSLLHDNLIYSEVLKTLRFRAVTLHAKRGKDFSTGFRGQREEERIGSWPKECTPSMAEASEETESRPNSAGGATSLLWERDRAKREQAGKDLPDREEMEVQPLTGIQPPRALG